MGKRNYGGYSLSFSVDWNYDRRQAVPGGMCEPVALYDNKGLLPFFRFRDIAVLIRQFVVFRGLFRILFRIFFRKI